MEKVAQLAVGADLQALQDKSSSAIAAAALAEQRAVAAESEVQRLRSEVEVMQVHAVAAAAAPGIERRYREVRTALGSQRALNREVMGFSVNQGHRKWDKQTQAFIRYQCILLKCDLARVEIKSMSNLAAIHYIVMDNDGRLRSSQHASDRPIPPLQQCGVRVVAGYRAAVPEADAAGGDGWRESSGVLAAGASRGRCSSRE